MRWGICLAVLCAVAVLHGVGEVTGQDEKKTTSEAMRDVIDPRLIWNFHFEGKKKRGQFLELLEPDEARNRTLIITHLELRLRTSTRAALVEHRRVAKSRKAGGGTRWKKYLRRSELFSLGWPEATTQYMASGYSSRAGMKFLPGSRPALEITFGSGNMAVYAEGYWSRP